MMIQVKGSIERAVAVAVDHSPPCELGHTRFVFHEEIVNAAGMDRLHCGHRLNLRPERQRVLHLRLGQVLHQ